MSQTLSALVHTAVAAMRWLKVSVQETELVLFQPLDPVQSNESVHVFFGLQFRCPVL
jgi:hypothetical protein